MDDTEIVKHFAVSQATDTESQWSFSGTTKFTRPLSLAWRSTLNGFVQGVSLQLASAPVSTHQPCGSLTFVCTLGEGVLHRLTHGRWERQTCISVQLGLVQMQGQRLSFQERHQLQRQLLEHETEMSGEIAASDDER